MPAAPEKRGLLRPSDKLVLAVAISVDAVGILRSQPSFQRAVFVCLFRMRTQIIAKREMPLDFLNIGFFENVKLMRAPVAAFAKIAAPWYSEFTHRFISGGPKRAGLAVDSG